MIITLTGNNTWALSTELKRFKQDWTEQNLGMNVEQFEAARLENSESFLLDLQTSNLFSPKRMVVLKYLSENKQLSEKIEQAIESIPAETDLVIFDPGLDLRTRLAKTLKAKTDWRQQNELDIFGLRKWLDDQVKQKGLKMSSAIQSYLLGRISSQAQLAQELTKLSLVDGNITTETVDILVAPSLEDNVFDFLEAFISGNTQRALKFLEDFQTSKMDPSYLFNMIIWQLNVVSVALMTTQPLADVAARTGLKTHSLSKARGLKNKINIKQLTALIEFAASVDSSMREGQPWEQLETLVFNWT